MNPATQTILEWGTLAAGTATLIGAWWYEHRIRPARADAATYRDQLEIIRAETITTSEHG